MKKIFFENRVIALLLLMMTLIFSACSDDDKKDGDKVNHVGDQWKITSTEYSLINQSGTKQDFKMGTATDAGFFYFDGAQGSFDITIEGYHKEDVFTFSEDGSSVNITSISQSAGAGSVSQFVISFSGEKDPATGIITLNGSITKQTTTSQFVLEGAFVLEKQQ